MAKPHPYTKNVTEVTISTTTTSGATTAGALAVTVYNRGTSAGTLAGASLAAGEGWVFEDNGPYNAIAYDATGTTFEIVEEVE